MIELGIFYENSFGGRTRLVTPWPISFERMVELMGQWKDHPKLIEIVVRITPKVEVIDFGEKEETD